MKPVELGSTNWRRYDVPQLATMLDISLDGAWDQVLTWQATSVVLDDHRRGLAAARNDLAQVWPPDHSPAAEAFLRVVDELDTAIVSAADASFANGVAVAGVLNALTDARACINQLHERWRASAVKLAGDGSNEPSDIVAASLNEQAHQVMEATDQAIFDSYRQLRKPSPYGLVSGLQNTTQIPAGSEEYSGSGGPPGSGTDEEGGGSTTLVTPIGDPQAGGIGANSGSVSPIVTPLDPAPGSGNRAVTTIDGAVDEDLEKVSTPGMPSMRQSNQISEGYPKSAGSGSTAAKEQGPPNEVPRADNGPEPQGFLSPGTGVPPRLPGKVSRRRTSRLDVLSSRKKGVPSLLTPRSQQPIVHDPGPGVIGIDR